MAKLILSLDDVVLEEIPLSKERTTIGRKPHNDIQIDNLAVSGEHALIVTILNDSFLEDLGSTNGTLVNGNPVKKHILQSNDVIEIGKYKLKYVSEQAAGQASVADFEKTMVLRPAAMRKPPEPHPPAAAGPPQGQVEIVPTGIGHAAPAPAAAGAAKAHGDTRVGMAAAAPAAAPPPARRAMLQLKSGANLGKELELTKPLTTLGKPGVQVAVITRRPQGFFITHVEGANKPIVNGKPIELQTYALNDHDIIEIAGVEVAFFFRP